MKKPASEPGEVSQAVRVLYAGQRWASGKLCIAFHREDTSEYIVFTTPKTVRLWRAEVVGGYYTLTNEGDGKWVLNNKYEGKRTDNAELLAKWTMEQSAAHVSERAHKRKEQDRAAGNTMLECLAPIRQAYNATDRIGQLAIEVLVLEALRRRI